MELLSRLDSYVGRRHSGQREPRGNAARRGIIMAAATEDRSFSIGRVFSRAFGVMGRNPLVTFGVTFLLSALPTTLVQYGFTQLSLHIRDRDTSLVVVGSGIVAFLIGLVLRALVQGCLVRATIADSEGRKAGLAECLTAAATRALPLIGASFLFVLGLVLGMMLLIVPGVMFAIAFAVVAPVVVAEDVGVIDAFRRAAALTRGARWKIFGLALLILCLIWLIEAIVGVVAVLLFHRGTDPFSVPITVFNLVIGTLVAALSSTIQTGLYVELRNWKDGPQNDTLTDIFA